MSAFSGPAAGVKKTVSPRHAVLETLIGIATAHINEQLLAVAARLAAALLDPADMGEDSAALRPRFQAANWLQKNNYAFLNLASAKLERALRQEIVRFAPAPKLVVKTAAPAMSLVPYEEMDSRVALASMSAPFEVLHADALAALNVRLAALLDRETLRLGQNPFRPEVFLVALQDACAELLPDTHKLLAPLIKPALFADLAPMYEALNLALMKNGVLPGSVDSYQRRRNEAEESANNPARLAQQLRQFFHDNGEPEGAPQAPDYGHDFDLTIPGLPEAAPGRPARAAQPALLSYLSRLQPATPATGAGKVIYLPRLKGSLPKGSLTRNEENTLDLLSAIFETVFRDENISQETRDLIAFLQVPVLKAALADKEFFFQEAHPARRLIDLLSHIGWEQRQGPHDALFSAMQRSVERVGRDAEREPQAFAEALAELEASVREDQHAAAAAIAQPIASALQQEKIAHAARSATSAVALRIGNGDVLAFVETFLENKWVAVMTIAYSVEDDKPGAVEHASRTMDELIWSVQPKPAAPERKRLIGKLPALLAALNQWLDIIKWQEADRLQFFAELAECHASIVRAPLELSPERQVEIALEVAQKAAQRRLERQQRAAAPAAAEAPAEPEPDAAAVAVDALQRGMWIEVAQADAAPRKVKLAWISPLRTLFIFSTDARQEAFSMSGQALAELFRAGQAHKIASDGLVVRALSRVMAAVNDVGAAA
jgi:hypothetical protein